LGVPVLFHASPKPSYSCINSVKKYFASLKTPIQEDELVVIGDRVFTDVVLANRMKQKIRPPQPSEANSEKVPRRGPLAVLTAGVWQRESMFMRAMENKMVNLVGGATYASPRRFVKPFVEEKIEVVQDSGMNKLLSWFGRKS
jgi:phosphatidylglycerophosphatase GEP4